MILFDDIMRSGNCTMRLFRFNETGHEDICDFVHCFLSLKRRNGRKEKVHENEEMRGIN